MLSIVSVSIHIILILDNNINPYYRKNGFQIVTIYGLEVKNQSGLMVSAGSGGIMTKTCHSPSGFPVSLENYTCKTINLQ